MEARVRRGVRVTQAMLARELGVTQETISHALRGTGTLSQGTRERIRALAVERGYRPHANARSMQKGAFDAIGLISSTHGLAWPILPPTLRGIFEVLHASDVSMMFASMPDERFLGESGAPRLLTEMMVDAFVVNLGPDSAQGAVEMVQTGHIPVVFINQKQERNCVYPDEFAAGYHATERLLGLGHREIGFIQQESVVGETRHFSLGDRERGYVAALDAAMLPPHIIAVSAANRDVLRRSLRGALLGEGCCKGRLLSAFVTGVRGFAESLLVEALQVGLEPGRDFSLIVIDIATEPFGHIQIDCLRTPLYWLGRAAAEHALELRQAGGATRASTIVPYRDWIAGDTCGPCAPSRKIAGP